MLANLYHPVEQGTYKFLFSFRTVSPSGTAFDHENGKLTHPFPMPYLALLFSIPDLLPIPTNPTMNPRD